MKEIISLSNQVSSSLLHRQPKVAWENNVTLNHCSRHWMCVCVCVCVCVVWVSRSALSWLYVTPWTAAHQAHLSMGFSRQEYWSGLSCPPPGGLPNPGTELTSPVLQAMLAIISAYVSTLCQREYEIEVQSLTLCTRPHGWVKSRTVIRPRATVRKSYSFHCIMLFLHWESRWVITKILVSPRTFLPEHYPPTGLPFFSGNCRALHLPETQY